MKMPHGQWKDYEMEDIPSDYLLWVAQNWEQDEIATAADEEWRDREDNHEHWYKD